MSIVKEIRMVCQSCGRAVQGPFCSQCGAPTGPGYSAPPPGAYPPPPLAYGYAPPAPYPGRVHCHVQTLGILWCVYATFHAIGGIIASLLLTRVAATGILHSWGMGMPYTFPFTGRAPWMAGLAGLFAGVIILFSILSFLAGYALLTRKPWGRVLAIVIGILQLIKMPFGTALGIYTLWVLAPSHCGAEYEALAGRAQGIVR